MSSTWTYEEALASLKTIRTSYIKTLQRDKLINTPGRRLEFIAKLLPKVGIPLSRLDQLSVIHVSGTKGKGSTCAMCESILRHHGLRTGLFSNPYLVRVEEMVRVDGRVLPPAQFADYVQRLFGLVQDSLEDGEMMPHFFVFMIILAFLVFLEQRVDVAVVEVGLGGTYDPTNVLRKVSVVGITSLELDHTDLLGSSLEEIAAAKAGIIKPGCVAFSAPQRDEARAVLKARAQSLGVTLREATPLVVNLGWDRIPTLRINAALAVQLAHAWLERARRTLRPTGATPPQTAAGLAAFRWPGRYQVVRTTYATYYLDGAHTDDSVRVCVDWFMETSHNSTNKILLFSTSANRNMETFLQHLKHIPLKEVYLVEEYEGMIEKGKHVWTKISTAPVMGVEHVCEAFSSIQAHGDKPSVLITGSLKLIGHALKILDPTCTTSLV